MPTAIVRVYTNEGFVIAADGRNLNSEAQPGTDPIITDEAQKIFPAQHHKASLAYAIAGVAGLNT